MTPACWKRKRSNYPREVAYNHSVFLASNHFAPSLARTADIRVTATARRESSLDDETTFSM